MANYRNTFIKARPGKRRFWRKGYWYRCANCGGWCARPGSDRVTIPDYLKMEVDHIVPWSRGGSDDLHNLQAMCKPCNRSKSAQMNGKDTARSIKNAVFHPVDTFIKTPVRKALRQNKLLKATGITKRK